ncbi:MAG TPA: DNA-processing protein DprA [Vicinamibacterales bacterium]|jgi:DNA processing protein
MIQPTDRNTADATLLVALSLLPSWTWPRIIDALRQNIAPGEALARILHRHYRDKPGQRDELVALADAALNRAAAGGLAPVFWQDASYPVALTTIADPPPVLWTRGSVDVLRRPCVAIVGARAASPYGLSVATRLAGDLAAAGLVVVSGMARGVDSAAHRGALDASGPTVAVLGSGVDVIYPPEHAGLAESIASSGVLVSELVPGTPPLPLFFPLRNRIISGLSRAVVVIEAGERSGSLITARTALEQGRDVLAVPGNVLSGRNRGAHGLLRDGAKIVESADDILEELGMGAAAPNVSSAVLDPVLACLTPGEPSDLDAISERTGLSATRLLARLFELELQGAVTRVGGGRFVRS